MMLIYMYTKYTFASSQEHHCCSEETESNDTGLQTLNCGIVISKVLSVICPEGSATFSVTVT